MRISGGFAFSENLARCPRRDKRTVKIAMQQLSLTVVGEDLFADASVYRQRFPHGTSKSCLLKSRRTMGQSWRTGFWRKAFNWSMPDDHIFKPRTAVLPSMAGYSGVRLR
jgi:hypothetical protein